MIISKMGNDYSNIMPDERSAKVIGELMKLMVRESGMKVLDLGCAEGSVSFILNGMGMKVTGVDICHDSILKARAKGVEALEMDGHSMFFDKEYDVVFSINALDKMRKPNMVIGSVYRALKPEGKFIGEIASEGNNAQINNAIIKALDEFEVNGLYLFDYYQPDMANYKQRLENKGLLVNHIEEITFSISINEDIDEWIKKKILPFSDALFNSPSRREEFFEKVKADFIPRLEKENDTYLITQKSIIFSATKKA